MLRSSGGRVARVHYMANNYRQLSPGDHVICAVSGVPIAIANLRYWSVARQQPYASAAIATEALTRV